MTDPNQAALRSDPSAFVNELLADAQDQWGEEMYLDGSGDIQESDIDEAEVMNDLDGEE